MQPNDSSTDAANNKLLDFPCEFPIKALGANSQDLSAIVIEIIRRHVSELSQEQIKVRQSKKGRYQSITVMIIAQSQQQLDAIYQELTEHNAIIMAF